MLAIGLVLHLIGWLFLRAWRAVRSDDGGLDPLPFGPDADVVAVALSQGAYVLHVLSPDVLLAALCALAAAFAVAFAFRYRRVPYPWVLFVAAFIVMVVLWVWLLLAVFVFENLRASRTPHVDNLLPPCDPPRRVLVSGPDGAPLVLERSPGPAVMLERASRPGTAWSFALRALVPTWAPRQVVVHVLPLDVFPEVAPPHLGVVRYWLVCADSLNAELRFAGAPARLRVASPSELNGAARSLIESHPSVAIYLGSTFLPPGVASDFTLRAALPAWLSPSLTDRSSAHDHD